MTSSLVPHAAAPRKSRAHERCNLFSYVPARNGAERRLPKMHWRWCKRGRDIVALLHSRFGSALPADDAGMDAVKLLAQHYMRLKIDPERVTHRNLRLWASGLTEKDHLAGIIEAANKAKAPSAAQLGRDWRVTTEEVAELELKTITAFSVTQENDRTRQERRRRKVGSTNKRGRPSMGLSPEEKKVRTNAQAAKRMKAKRARSSTGRPPRPPKNPLRKNTHAPSYIEEMERDELSVTEFEFLGAERPQRDGAWHAWAEIHEGEIIIDRGVAWAPPRPARCREIVA